MASLTEESLSKLSEQELIPVMLKIQNKMESSVTKFAEEVRKLNESFQKLKSDLAITKNVNNQLHNHFVNMDRQFCINAQYSRRECVEILGIPTSVPANELEEAFCKIVDKIEFKINDRDIESCHRVGSQGRTIVKFSHKKDCQKLMKVKKDLSKLKLTVMDLGNTKIFIDQSLCRYYKLLWSKSKRVHAMKQIYSYYVSNGTVKVKLEENSRPISITYATDFDKHFPAIDRNPPVRCISPIVVVLLCLIYVMLGSLPVPFGVFINKKLCFFEILFPGV